MRVGPLARPAQPDLLEQLLDARVDHAPSGSPGSCTSIGSAIWAPTRCTGLSECRAPWKTIDAPAQRSARSSPHFIVLHVVAEDQHLAADLGVLRLEPQHRADQRRLAAAGLTCDAHDLARADDEVHAAHGGQRALDVAVRTVSPRRSRSALRGCRDGRHRLTGPSAAG